MSALRIEECRKSSEGMPRWDSETTQKLSEMRRILGSALTKRTQYPDVVGDRRLLRFLRSTNLDVERAAAKFAKFLVWRDANNVDDIRNDILFGGKNDPHLFPDGEKVLKYFPQIVCATEARDYLGNPVSVERFNFSPSEALKVVPKDRYVLFFMYCLEYKVLIMDQLSDEKERQNKATSKDSSCPYGVVLSSFYFRDFDGFSLDHLGGEGQSLIGALLEIATSNYPELLLKSHMINVPWIFNLVWVCITPFLDKNTIAKMNMHAWGSDYLGNVSNEISLENIPECVGGKFKGGNSPFVFDTSASGSFCEGGQISIAKSSSSSQKISTAPPVEHNSTKNRPPVLFDHTFLKNPTAWLYYLRLKVFAPLAGSGEWALSRLSARSKSPLVASVAISALTASATLVALDLVHCFTAKKR